MRRSLAVIAFLLLCAFLGAALLAGCDDQAPPGYQYVCKETRQVFLPIGKGGLIPINICTRRELVKVD